MRRIEPQPVQAEFVEPVERVLHEEIPHVARIIPVEVERPPARARPRGSKVAFREQREDVARESEVIVDDVEHDRQAPAVRRIDERAQIIR